MREYKGLYFPEGEEHLIEWLEKVAAMPNGQSKYHIEVDGKPAYQGHKYYAALAYCKPNRRRRAIDIGAHMGLWSRVMALDFELVTCFEPMNEHVRCWDKNMEHAENAFLHQYALGESEGTVRVRTRTKGSSGDTGIELESNEGQLIKMRTLDSFGLTVVDFLKVDCEGYELFILKGAEQTLLKWKPVIIVEQKPETGGPERYKIDTMAAVDYLKTLGAKVREGIQGDYILTWG